MRSQPPTIPRSAISRSPNHGLTAGDSLAGGSWEPADPAHVVAFTAVGYFFARELRRHHDVPIGLINTTWGGSRIEPWMSAGSLGLDADGVAEVLADEEGRRAGSPQAIRARIGDLPDNDHGLVDGRALWADPGLDDSSWQRWARRRCGRNRAGRAWMASPGTALLSASRPRKRRRRSFSVSGRSTTPTPPGSTDTRWAGRCWPGTNRGSTPCIRPL